MWTLKSEDRLKEWKEFRNYIGCLPFSDAVTVTAKYWGTAPFVSHYLDLKEPIDWPTPWELLSAGVYDDMARALGMTFTLFLTSHGLDHKFNIARARIGLENYNLVLIDDEKYILNYDFGEVISKEQLTKDIEIIRLYSAADLQLSKY
jgi:hypothetical protein